MPGGNWRRGLVAAGVSVVVLAGVAAAEDPVPPVALPPVAPSPIAPTSPPVNPPPVVTVPTAPGTLPVVVGPTVPPSPGTRIAPTVPAPPKPLPSGAVGGVPFGVGLPSTRTADLAAESKHPGEHEVKDLTPPGFATDLIPPPDEHAHVPGHLAPTLLPDPGPFVSVEYLLLRPRRDSFDYAILTRPAGLATAGRVESLNYELRSGIRTEVGYRFGRSGFDAAFAYTYLHSTTGASLTAGPGQELLPTLTRPGLTDRALTASGDANFDYNVFDLTLGRRFCLDEHTAFRAFAGLRFATIRQDFGATYNGLDARVAAVESRHRFDGFGPVVGGEAVATGWNGFHLYARASGGVLTGRTGESLRETNDAGGTVYTNLDYDTRRVVPVASLGVGAGWQYRGVWLRAGYEFTRYFDLTAQPQLVDDVGQGKFVARPGGLSLEGLVVQVGLAF